MSTSSFIELPDDILFTIVKFVRVPDLFAARKTCKRLHSITLDRHVWTTAYKTSENSFLPETSLASKTVQDLERLLLRSYRLNTFWANPPRIKRVFKRRISLDSTTSGIDIKNLLAIELFQGRFIILQTAKAMLVYDLETRDEVFRHNAAPNQEFKRAVLGLNRTADYNMDLFFPFRTFSFITGTSPSGSVTIAESPLLNANFVIGNQFAVIHNFGRGRASDVLVVSHLESQNIYPLSSGFLVSTLGLSSF
ncbi:hypothetical protein BDP27DRAFT_1409296 [Rhodocollybia butyracea]|uniref:F-box domain-containing protein n=1 Tax=Rhodocollybia butyracea TaxID=206335 RepID=A0A9P5TVL5_9AGAR|nr:hypothetical protein BDP27DRAFT_1409296 [Rhodocollybia butyracea]